jgi:N utilization substance protein B
MENNEKHLNRKLILMILSTYHFRHKEYDFEGKEISSIEKILEGFQDSQDVKEFKTNGLIEHQGVIKELVNNISLIDEIISSHLFNYTIDRLNIIDRCILEIATYELKFTELDPRIIINEAIELTKIYSEVDDKQHSFNNSVLDKIRKSLRGEAIGKS